MSALFTDAARKSITSAVEEAEKGTAGEIVVVIARASASYAGARAMFAAMVALFAVVVAAVLVPEIHALWIALGAPLVALLAWAAAAPDAMRRVLILERDADDAVRQAAAVAFLDHGVHRTRDRSGVLVYISLLEHRVHIMGDSGIHAFIKDDGWRAHVATVVTALRAGKAEDVAQVVRDIGAVLAKEFPRRPDDTNELPNEVVVKA